MAMVKGSLISHCCGIWTALILAVLPSALVPVQAAPQQVRTSTVALISGRVLDAQLMRPISDATVQLVGDQIHGSVQSDETGSFSLPVPAAGTYRVQAVRLGYEGKQSEAITVSVGDTIPLDLLLTPTPLLLDSILVSVARTERPLRTGEQLILGRLVDDESEEPIGTGTVRLLNRRGSTVAVVLSDDEGLFRLVSPRPGTYRMTGERIGYRTAQSSELHLIPGDTVTVQLRLSTQAILLEPLTIIASARPWWNRADLRGMRPFLDRWAQFERPGFGEFMTRDSIAEYEGWVLNTGHMLLLNTLSVRMVTPDGGVILRRGCRPRYFVNGAPAGGAARRLFPGDLEGVEIYTRPNIPADLNQGGFPCGVVLYWTRVSPDPDPPRRSIWTPLVVGVGIALGILAALTIG